MQTTTSEALRNSLVGAVRSHVISRLADLGVAAPPGLDEAILSAEAWLTDQLTGLLSRPFADQRRGPLEVFQEAMSFPTRALADAGVEPVRRDPVAVNAIPGDVYGLAPASSSLLGEDVWRAHLAWGADKAAAIIGGRG